MRLAQKKKVTSGNERKKKNRGEVMLCYKREKKEHKDRKRQKRKIRNRTLDMKSLPEANPKIKNLGP